MCRCFSDLPTLAHWNLDVSQFCVSMENHIAYTFLFFWLKRMPKQVSWVLPRCRTFLSSVLPCKFQLPPWLWSLSFLVSKTTVVCQGSPFLCYCLENDSGHKKRETYCSSFCLPSLRVHCTGLPVFQCL